MVTDVRPSTDRLPALDSDPMRLAGPASGPSTPARYRVTIAHRRRDPIEYAFTQRGSMWLVDLDDLPRLPGVGRRLARFDTRDHFDDPSSSLRENVDRFCAEHGVDRPHQVLMLANPRVLGYVFNPLSVFYLYDQHGRSRFSIAEVHNTYGGRHVYLAENTDSHDRAELDKAFYVSPFYPVDGRYTMSLPEPGERLQVTVTLRRADDRPFVATMTGRRVPVDDHGPGLAVALRTPLATRAVMAGIKRHGITLYAKGLRPFPRPSRRPGQRADRAPDQPATSPQPSDSKKVGDR